MFAVPFYVSFLDGLEDMPAFEDVVFRLTKENELYSSFDIDDPNSYHTLLSMNGTNFVVGATKQDVFDHTHFSSVNRVHTEIGAFDAVLGKYKIESEAYVIWV